MSMPWLRKFEASAGEPLLTESLRARRQLRSIEQQITSRKGLLLLMMLFDWPFAAEFLNILGPFRWHAEM